ncbi:S-layer homology domain-containing protein [Arthrobacter bambusae]|uniref:S-layer homology domain-containing protein n=1 Tax=Arthrobacter sp. NPDC058127 TaxID=3346351 RepID=UPI0036E50390
MSPTLFDTFVTWLAARTANGTTSVRTVAQALGQSTPPPPPPPPPASSPFSDVPTNYTYFTEINWLATQGISTGWVEANGTKTYRPLQPVNRDAMAAFMYRLAGSPAFTPPAVSPFADLTPQTPFYKEITWLATQGISTGWDEGNGIKTYRPLQPVNRDAMAAFMYRLAGSPAFTAPAASPFTDVTPQTAFYKEITWLSSTGISTGWTETNGTRTYRPVTAVARDAMAAFMYRYNTSFPRS